MNPEAEVHRLLDECGAVLVRQNKHRVYRLPNNQNFVMASTASDHRAMANNLADLRRMLNTTRERVMTPTTTEATPEVPLSVPVEASPAPEPVAVASDATLPAPPAVPTEPKVETLAERITAAIAAAEQEQEQLLLAAQIAERRVHLLKALEQFADDPTVERTLGGLIKVPRPTGPVIKTTTPDAPQGRVTSSVYPVIVTRDRVFETATRLGADDRAFSTVSVTQQMIGDQHVNPKDRNRIHASISHAMVVLADRGLVVLHEKGYGKRPSLWRMPGGTQPKVKTVAKPVECSDPVPNAKLTTKVNGVKVLKTYRTQ
jgi:hypothetical protein